MRRNPITRRAGFTIVELIIALSLSTVVMIGVLYVYIFVARSYTRTIGFGLPNEPTLESQGRRTLSTLALDVQMSSAITSPSASEITLTVPRPTGGTQNVTYYYNPGEATTMYGAAVPAMSLVRIDRTTNAVLTMHGSLLTCVFTYYDTYGYPYTAYTDYLIGIKQLSLVLTAQTGNAANNTLTRVYQVASSRLVFRNKSLPP